MGYPATLIPEKIFFKIGEVCDLVGVQAHVLRYWETEFPMLSPQKNRSGQRTYRRRDVEIAFRIKELLYDELFTIAGAKKKLQTELRESSRLKIVHPQSEPAQKETFFKPIQAPSPVPQPLIAQPVEEIPDEIIVDELPEKFDEIEEFTQGFSEEFTDEQVVMTDERREALKSLAAQLLELREMVKNSQVADENFRLRKY
jgi:DNA-binding transcriptional MerR regulator